MEKETREYLAFKRELLARKYSQSSIDTYLSCFAVIQDKADFDIDVQKVKDLLGHSDVKTTEIYTKTSQARRKIPSLLSNMSF